MRKIILVFIALCINNTIICTQDISYKLDQYMQATAQLNRFSGTVVIGTKDTIYLNKGYGYANKEHDIPNSAQTIFRACSITKMVTATAILQLQEKGHLNVNDTIDKYFDSFPHADEITIHHLLSHTSGISSANLTFEMAMLPTTLEDIINYFKNLPLEFTPGTDYQYSNANYFLLTAIVEYVSGMKYEDFIVENIFNPAGMQNSLFVNHDYMIIKNAASPYVFDKENRCVNGHYIYDANNRGCGALLCTASDLYLFIKAFDNGSLLKEDSLLAMRTSYHDKECYGYGCCVSKYQSERSVDHGGMLSNGFKTIVITLVDQGIYIVLLGNMFWRKEIIYDLIKIVLQQPCEMPSTNPIDLADNQYDECVGIYDHPDYAQIGYAIYKKDAYLLTADNKKLVCVGVDMFIEDDHKADNVVYLFIRNELGIITQLRMQGCGGPYFEIRCDKKEE